jgi:hypothetical protein
MVTLVAHADSAIIPTVIVIATDEALRGLFEAFTI